MSKINTTAFHAALIAHIKAGRYFSDKPEDIVYRKEQDKKRRIREEKEEEIRQQKWAEGYDYCINGIFYTQQDIDENKCPLNGYLVEQGIKHAYVCVEGNRYKDCRRCKKLKEEENE